MDRVSFDIKVILQQSYTLMTSTLCPEKLTTQQLTWATVTAVRLSIYQTSSITQMMVIPCATSWQPSPLIHEELTEVKHPVNSTANCPV